MEELNNIDRYLADIIDFIINSKEYKTCLELKEKMKNNEEIILLIKEIKDLQKKYIKSNYSENYEIELNKKNERINSIPIYCIYNNNLKIVNEMISIVNDELNNYFYRKFNKAIEL